MKTTFIKFNIYLLIIVFFNSCMMTKTNVGEFKEQEGKEYTYAKGKQIWLFWGIIPLGRTSVATPTDGNCQIITKRNFVDIIVTFLTIGIVTTHSIKVVAKKKETTQ